MDEENDASNTISSHIFVFSAINWSNDAIFIFYCSIANQFYKEFGSDLNEHIFDEVFSGLEEKTKLIR